MGQSQFYNEPIFRLPPFHAERLFLSLSETQDWGIRMLNIPSLWRQSEGEGIKVAILDTGISLNHVDLEGAVKRGGYRDFTGSPHGIADQNGHGTHCAGIVAARRNNTGIVGVAPKAELLIAKVLADNGSGSAKSIVNGIQWSVERGAHILSMSLGAQVEVPEIHDALKKAIDQGVYVVCAAGNDALEFVDYPAAYPETIAVGSINVNQRLSSFSSIGKEVTIVAPGENILSTYPPSSYATLSGTSMATPFVAGVVALILSKHQKYGGKTPITSQQDLIEHLSQTAIDLGDAGFDERYGFGLINPASLLELKSRMDCF